MEPECVWSGRLGQNISIGSKYIVNCDSPEYIYNITTGAFEYHWALRARIIRYVAGDIIEHSGLADATDPTMSPDDRAIYIIPAGRNIKRPNPVCKYMQVDDRVQASADFILFGEQAENSFGIAEPGWIYYSIAEEKWRFLKKTTNNLREVVLWRDRLFCWQGKNILSVCYLNIQTIINKSGANESLSSGVSKKINKLADDSTQIGFVCAEMRMIGNYFVFCCGYMSRGYTFCYDAVADKILYEFAHDRDVMLYFGGSAEPIPLSSAILPCPQNTLSFTPADNPRANQIQIRDRDGNIFAEFAQASHAQSAILPGYSLRFMTIVGKSVDNNIIICDLARKCCLTSDFAGMIQKNFNPFPNTSGGIFSKIVHSAGENPDVSLIFYRDDCAKNNTGSTNANISDDLIQVAKKQAIISCEADIAINHPMYNYDSGFSRAVIDIAEQLQSPLDRLKTCEQFDIGYVA